MKIGIMGAMIEEVALLKQDLQDICVEEIGGRSYYHGKLYGADVVLVFSRWGKVASATTVTTLITRYNIDQLIFTGIAGAVSPNLNIGDIVIGESLYQHDMDARPIFKQHEIPLTETIFFRSDNTLVSKTHSAAKGFLTDIEKTIHSDVLRSFAITHPSVHIGKIASGDVFIANQTKTANLITVMPDVLAVEMEGAAVAQVCTDHQIPFVVVRTISDKADHSAVIDFQKFVANIAQYYSKNIIEHIFSRVDLTVQ
jgi:adenosylhomocysteine nucleosidase